MKKPQRSEENQTHSTKDNLTQYQHSIQKFQKIAQSSLPNGDYQYFRRGADEEVTLKQNVLAFRNIKILPRVLRDMTKVQLSKSFLKDNNASFPFGICPFAFQKLLHPQGQKICAWLSQEKNIPYCISMMSTTSLKQLKQNFPKSVKMLQIYILKDQQIMKKIIKLAQQNGCIALVVTVDSPIFGKKRSGERENFKPQLDFQIFKQCGIDIQFKPKDQTKSFRSNLLTELRWEHITILKKMTKLKIILKGVLNVEDALIANDLNIDAAWISNHGGRQLDTCPLAFRVLPIIKNQLKKIKSKMQVYVDGGVRRGSDIFKYYALGADFVFLGRGICYSLVNGYKGIQECCQMFRKQLQTTMKLSGTKSIKQITGEFLFQNNFLSSSKL